MKFIVILIVGVFCFIALPFWGSVGVCDELPGGDMASARYVLEKLKAHDLVFLGSYHKQPVILEFVASLIPILAKVGVTHVGLEIPNDQQGNIDRFLTTGEGLADIALWPQIDCVAYRVLFMVLRNLPPDDRLEVVELDKPLAKHGSGTVDGRIKVSQ
ncbi:MAG: hypothetical protein HKM93_02750 [Desulfobacteraceae bacterium]|nr:hypothetical protein [Desulfobacteraceae bacterium]